MDKEYPMEPGLYLMDCMEGMKRFPDGFFDIAICDPPYGDGSIGGGYNQIRQMRECGTGSVDGSTGTRKWNRFGQRFDRYKGTVERVPQKFGGGYRSKSR